MFCIDINCGEGKEVSKEKLNYTVEKIIEALKEADLPMALAREVLKETEREIDLRARL